MPRTNKAVMDSCESANNAETTLFDQVDRLCEVVSCIHGITAIFDQLMALCRNPDAPEDLDNYNGLQMAYALTFRYLESNVENVLNDLGTMCKAAPAI